MDDEEEEVKASEMYIRTNYIDNIRLQKMTLIYNALEDGWTIKKREKSYVFRKKHQGREEILEDNYLETFMKNNLDITRLLGRDRDGL